MVGIRSNVLGLLKSHLSTRLYRYRDYQSMPNYTEVASVLFIVLSGNQFEHEKYYWGLMQFKKCIE